MMSFPGQQGCRLFNDSKAEWKRKSKGTGCAECFIHERKPVQSIPQQINQSWSSGWLRTWMVSDNIAVLWTICVGILCGLIGSSFCLPVMIIFTNRGLSSVGRALPWRGRGHGFESLRPHRAAEMRLFYLPERDKKEGVTNGYFLWNTPGHLLSLSWNCSRSS